MRRAKASNPKPAQDSNLPKYSIAVASDLSGVPQQQLRRLEDGGLVAPARTEGNTRRYSDADLERITEVAALAEEGVNSTGIKYILALRRELDELREEMAAVRCEIGALRESARTHALSSERNTDS